MKEIEKAKQIIRSEIEAAGFKIKRMFLFGSRARSDYKKDSDWDFYVVIDNNIPFIEKRKIITQIRRRMAKNRIPNDIIIQSIEAFEKRKNNVGYLAYYVIKEGIDIL